MPENPHSILKSKGMGNSENDYRSQLPLQVGGNASNRFVDEDKRRRDLQLGPKVFALYPAGSHPE
jgi:hypothetical protein